MSGDASIQPIDADVDSAALSPVRRWVIAHDDSKAFVFAYIAMAVLLSFISLFWLVAVVGVHFGLEWCRQHHYTSRRAIVLSRVMWELKLDFALVLLAFVVAVYMDFAMGAAGLGAGARLGMQSAARFAGWQRVLRGVLLSVDDLAQITRAAALRSNSDNGTDDARSQSGWTVRWPLGDRIAVALAGLALALLVAAPVITDHSLATMLAAIVAELHPFPG